MQLYEYPEICAMILQFLPIERIIELYNASAIIHRSLDISSYLIDREIEYREYDDYSNYPRNHFIIWTDRCHLDYDEHFAKFARTKFLYKDIHFKNIDYINKFDIIELRYDEIIDGCCSFDEYDRLDKTKCTDLLSRNPRDTNCSLILEKISDLEIRGTQINHLTLINAERVVIYSEIRGNVVLNGCKNIRIMQKNINKLRICRLGASDSHFNDIDYLDIDTHGEQYTNKFGDVKTLRCHHFDKNTKIGKIDTIEYYNNSNDKNAFQSYHCRKLVTVLFDFIEISDYDTLEELIIRHDYDPYCEEVNRDNHTIEIKNCPKLEYVEIEMERNRLIYSIENCPLLKKIKSEEGESDNIINCPMLTDY